MPWRAITGSRQEELMAEVAERIVRIAIPGAALPLVGAIEMLPEIARGLAGSSTELVAVSRYSRMRDCRKRCNGSVERIFAGTEHAPTPGRQDREDEEPLPSGSSASGFLSTVRWRLRGWKRTLALPEGLFCRMPCAPWKKPGRSSSTSSARRRRHRRYAMQQTSKRC